MEQGILTGLLTLIALLLLGIMLMQYRRSRAMLWFYREAGKRGISLSEENDLRSRLMDIEDMLLRRHDPRRTVFDQIFEVAPDMSARRVFEQMLDLWPEMADRMSKLPDWQSDIQRNQDIAILLRDYSHLAQDLIRQKMEAGEAETLRPIVEEITEEISPRP